LYSLRLLAGRVGGRDEFTQLLAGVRKALDTSHLDPSDAMIWRAALGQAAPVAGPAAGTGDMLAAVGARSRHLPPADAAGGADPAGLIDTEAPALGSDGNLPGQAVRVLRLASATSLLLACGGRNRKGEVRAIAERAIQQANSGAGQSTATVSGLAMLAEAACL